MPPIDTALLASDLRVVLGQLIRRLRVEHRFPISQGTVLGRLDREGASSVSDLAVAERVRPWLRGRRIVLSDRYTDASVAYQGYAGGLDPELIRELNVRATGGVLPDLTLLFDCDPALSFRRIGRRRLDHFERQALAFHRRVRRGYREIQRAEPKRVRLIDAARSRDVVAAEVQAIVGEFLRGA